MYKGLKYGVVGVAILVAIWFGAHYFVAHAHAADLGGNCCADLEERIAELEATTATKNNRKISVTIEGQVDEAFYLLSTDGYTHKGIINNGNDGSWVGVTGKARVTKDVVVGYKLEMAWNELGLLGTGIEDNHIVTRQSYWFIKSDTLGQFSVGRQGQASWELNKFSTNLSWLVNKPLSFGASANEELTGLDLPFDGRLVDSIKYMTPNWNGFQVAGSWGTSAKSLIGPIGGGGQGDTWDVALTYAGEPMKELRVTGAASYRHDTELSVDLLGITVLDIPTGDLNTWTVQGSALYVPLGGFVNVNYANTDLKASPFGLNTLTGVDVTAGFDEKFFAIGHTEAFASWGQVGTDFGGKTGTIDTNYWGLGAVQSIDAAAMDLYIGWRQYQSSDLLPQDVDVFTAGARVRF